MERLRRNQIYQNEYELLDKADNLMDSPEFSGNPLLGAYNELFQGYKKLLQESAGLVNISDKQQERLYKLQSDLKNLLDHTGQGIFTVNPELTIRKGCSSECKKIFNRKIEGEKFSELIRPFNDVEKIELIESVLNREFFNQDPFQQQVMLLLLPDELRINERVCGVKYKPVTLELKEKLENAFMVILTDITEKKIMQKAMDEEKRIFETITKIISNLKLFTGCIREYQSFYQQQLPALLNNRQSCLLPVIDEIFRSVHTLKGNFAIFEIPWLVDFLEEVEQTLSVVRAHADSVSFSELNRLVQRFDFQKALEDSLHRVYRIIGEQWVLDYDFIMVKSDDLKMMALKIEKVVPNLALELKKYCDINILELLRAYPEYTWRLADRMGKKVARFEIECPEEIRVDPERFEELARSLVHVFRNMVDHGIETPEERYKAGKDETGNIRCWVVKEERGFQIGITDDGRGIDVDRLKQKAVQLGVITIANARDLPFEQVLQLVFRDGLSTSDETNGISGRGVGLAKVKQEIDRLGGMIEISTKTGEGTSFVIHFITDK